MIEFIFQIVLFLGYLITSVYIDVVDITNKTYIKNHKPRWYQRFVSVIAIGFVGRGISVESIYLFIGYGLVFTALFDQVLNLFRNMDLGYLGTVSKWDNFWRKRKKLYYAFKAFSLVVGIYLIIKFGI